jgi:hypothetical protein
MCQGPEQIRVGRWNTHHIGHQGQKVDPSVSKERVRHIVLQLNVEDSE